jgi:hypothetical protein
VRIHDPEDGEEGFRGDNGLGFGGFFGEHCYKKRLRSSKGHFSATHFLILYYTLNFKSNSRFSADFQRKRRGAGYFIHWVRLDFQLYILEV